MNFEEWLAINPLSEFLANVQVSYMKTAWTASRNHTSDESVKILENLLDPESTIDEIKELKE